MSFESRGTVTIRPAVPADAVRLALLCEQLGYPMSTSAVVERLKDVMTANSIVYVAATADGEVIGWVHAYVSHLVMQEPFVEIGGLVVDANHRRCGAGRCLMQAAEAWARQQGCAEVRLRSNITREDAHRFYAALGYANLKTSCTFGKRL